MSADVDRPRPSFANRLAPEPDRWVPISYSGASLTGPAGSCAGGAISPLYSTVPQSLMGHLQP
jgi:hypothetical protein